MGPKQLAQAVKTALSLVEAGTSAHSACETALIKHDLSVDYTLLLSTAIEGDFDTVEFWADELILAD